MRHLTLSLLLGAILSLNLGCQKNTEDPALFFKHTCKSICSFFMASY